MSMSNNNDSYCNDDRTIKTGDARRLACVVHSKHPLTLGTIRRILSSMPGVRCSITSYVATLTPIKAAQCEVLVLDTCSVESWPEDLQKWQSGDRPAIALISPEMEQQNEALKILSLGVKGIVPFSEDLDTKLPNALTVVSEGGFWVKRQVLNEYVKRTSQLLRRMSSCDRLITARERQIGDFLREGLSNKQIAGSLQISERTVKFHVSNILRKCEFESRRQLRGRPWKDPLGV